MSKYIIEIPDGTEYGILTCRTSNGYYTQDIDLETLEELNSDYINEHYGELQDEAYQRGHDDGYEAGCATAFKPVSDAEYQRGLDDAMSAFKKLYSCGWERDWKAMGFEFDEGEWSASFEYIIGHYTAAEIVEKLKAYEEKELHVGDEVIALCGKAIVTSLHNNFVDYLYSDGDCGCTELENLTKTGKHYDIQSILEAMRQ